MKGTMKTAVMLDIGKIGFEEREIPQVKDDEVLVKLEYVGICGSDLHYYESGAIGDFIVKPPFVLGHEPGGTVVEVGKDVKHLKVGDRVALEPGKTCGHCEFCKTGRYNLCPDVVFFATPPVDGVFQEYVAHEADLCFKLPDNVSTMEGALIEPLMRPVFKVPGYASIDAVTSFVANPTLGIFLTNRLYKEKMYTTREAASIATNFSFISLGFFAVLVESAGILDHYGDVVLWSFILGLAEVALPSAFISGLGVAPAAAFFVVTVTALQIIMFSNSAVSIMESDIPLNAGKLVIIFFLRTLIAMPLVAIVTHIIF